ncbi:MAG: phosphatidylserine decarboxylase family protein [Planctomycetota bacterium]|nr:MAG: phosphatidylserine decarboxylase family protein [Planctomycetota bacterium]
MITRHATKEIIYFFVLTMAAIGVIACLAYVTGAAWLNWLIIFPVLFYGFVLFFFRDPGRKVPPGEENVVAPADGYITDIETVEEPEFLGGKALRIGIFLSLFTPHINRSPVDGTVRYIKYHPGQFHNALHSRICGRENEANSIGIDNGSFPLLVKQIAGIIARRIVCTPCVGATLSRGERIGMIKFGSRTELYIPVSVNFTPKVKLGERVRAGSSIIGVIGKEVTP